MASGLSFSRSFRVVTHIIPKDSGKSRGLGNYLFSAEDFAVLRDAISIRLISSANESIYWLTLLKRTNLIVYDFDNLLSLAEEIKRMLIASLNTAKSSAENK